MDDMKSTGRQLLPEELLSMSGLDYMQGLLEGRFARPPMARTLGYHLHAVDDGRVVFRGTPQAGHTNPMGGVHGGWYGTLLDSALGCAVMTKVPRGSYYTTLEYKVNLSRAIPLDTQIDAIAEVQHAGRSTATANGWIVGVADGKLYATGSTTCIIMKG